MTGWNGARANALAPSVYTLEQKQKSVTYAPGLMCNLSARLYNTSTEFVKRWELILCSGLRWKDGIV